MQSFLDLFADDPKKPPKCSICSDPLPGTNLPILDVAGNSLVCEKCSNTTTPDAVSSALKVPCRYKMFGCNRQISQAGLADHVKACDFRIYQCIGPCVWQGSSVAFKIHIVERHKDLIIENGCFKIPRRDTEAFNVIFACNEMFIVQFRVGNSKFYLSVKYVGKPPDCGRFTYQVSLKDAISKQATTATIYNGKMKSFSDLTDLSGKTDIEFTTSFLDEIFKSQTVNCIIAIVEKDANKNKKTKQKEEKGEKQVKASNNESKSQKGTKEKTKGKDSNKNKKDVAASDNQKPSSSKEGKANVKSPLIDLISDVQKPSSSKVEGSNFEAPLIDVISDVQQPPSSTSEIGTLQKNLIQELECPICQEYMSAPIFLCTLGHSICSECRPKLLKCPTCSSAYGNTRNYTLESMLNLIHVPCRNERYGCDFIGTASVLQMHNSLCEYGRTKCPVPDVCTWTGNVDVLDLHLQSCHQEDCYKLNEEIVRDLKATETTYHLARFGGGLFRISCKYNKKKGRFVIWSVEKVSSNKSDKRYILEIEFVDQTDNERKFVINDVCRDVTETEKIFDDALSIPLQLLKPFVDSEQSLHFRYKISVSSII